MADTSELLRRMNEVCDAFDAAMTRYGFTTEDEVYALCSTSERDAYKFARALKSRLQAEAPKGAELDWLEIERVFRKAAERYDAVITGDCSLSMARALKEYFEAKLRALRTSQAEAPTREAYWTLLVGVMGLNTTTSNSHVNMWRAADALVHLHRNSRISQAEAQTPAVTRETREKAIAYLMELSFNNEGFYHYSPRRGCTLSENVCRTIVNVLADRLATAPAPVLTEEERELCDEIRSAPPFLHYLDRKELVAIIDRLTQHKPAS